MNFGLDIICRAKVIHIIIGGNSMKKNLLISVSCVLFIVVIFVLIVKPWAQKPFKNLSASNIKSVSVELLPPNETYDLSDNEIIELIEILNSVVVYNKDNSYDRYDGQAVIYTITKMDGTTLTVNAYNPFLIIDGVGYKTKYEPCEELNAFGNRIGKVK